MQRLEKTRAFLTEFIIVILFFTVSAVITVQLFVAANKKSVESISITDGYIKAEALSEEVKAVIKENGREAVNAYMTDKAGYMTDGTGEYYYQYFDTEYNVTKADEAYVLGYVKIVDMPVQAGMIYNVTVGFKNNTETISSISVKIYEGEVQ